MVDIKVSEYDFGKTFKIIDGENVFEIMYGGNGDLYFSPVMNKEEHYFEDVPIKFNIDKNDRELYKVFLNLYNKICAYSPFDLDEVDNDFLDDDSEYEKKKDQRREFPLVHDGIISWRSDEEAPSNAAVLNITKGKNNIGLEFIKNKPEDEIYLTYSIRFRNSGSTYDPFNIRFMELYNKLCSIDFSKSEGMKERLLKHRKVISVSGDHSNCSYGKYDIYGFTLVEGAYDTLYSEVNDESILDEIDEKDYYVAMVKNEVFDGDYHTYSQIVEYDGLFIAIDMSNIDKDLINSRMDEFKETVRGWLAEYYKDERYPVFDFYVEENEFHNNKDNKNKCYLSISIRYKELDGKIVEFSKSLVGKVNNFFGMNKNNNGHMKMTLKKN